MGRGRERWIKHYSSTQGILLVGEGDFSFSACLARAFGSAHNMVATSLESQGSLRAKHRSCLSHLSELKRRGCLVLHDVDVYEIDLHPALQWRKFDVIIFNLPHAGHFPWLRERNPQLIQMHKNLLKVLFENARGMLREGGEVHVATRDYYPYNICPWDAEEAGLVLMEKVWFKKWDYPGYQNKRGGDIKSNKTFRLRNCFTFKFALQQYEYDCTCDEMSVCSDDHYMIM